MSYNTSTQTSGSLDRAIASVFAASVMFVLGYTVVRVSLAERATAVSASGDADVQVVVPGEGTLWTGFGENF